MHDQQRVYLPWQGRAGCPFAGLIVVADPEGLVSIDFVARGQEHFIAESDHTELLQPALVQLAEYMQGTRRKFDLTMHIQGTHFQKKVWQAMLAIGYGETATYKEIACMVGGASKARAVGMAANRNSLPIIIPCHRIIGSNGSLVGYDGGLEVKEFLLQHESMT